MLILELCNRFDLLDGSWRCSGAAASTLRLYRLSGPSNIQRVIMRQRAEGMAFQERCENDIYLSDVRMLVKGSRVLKSPLAIMDCSFELSKRFSLWHCM